MSLNDVKTGGTTSVAGGIVGWLTGLFIPWWGAAMAGAFAGMFAWYLVDKYWCTRKELNE